MLLTIPARLKDRLEEIVPFLNVWLSVVFTVLVWLTSSWAANELNEVFRIPASLLPKALIALTFVLVIAIAGIALGVVAAFFQILRLLAALTISEKKSHGSFVTVSFFTICFIVLI